LSQTPFAHAESLRIGTVDFVSPDEVRVVLDIEAPESVALNAGGVRPFPRVNGYVLMPVDDGYLVGQIEWLTIERSAFPQRRGVRDFGLVDLPYPLRKMSVNPLGTLRKQPGEEERYVFRRGADVMPSVGGAVLLPTEKQLRDIVESGEHRRVRIGTSPLAGNAEVRIDPDRLFGRHLAVLGNTGSGKSCSVAGLIRWSLEAAQRKRQDGSRPNARFIVLDPNGEYSRAFGNDEILGSRIFKVHAAGIEHDLQVPLWFWNSAEWVAITQASAKTQRPALIQALRSVRDQLPETTESYQHELRRFLRTIVATIRMEKNSGNPWGPFPRPKAFFQKLEKWTTTLGADLEGIPAGEEYEALSALVSQLEELCSARRVQYPDWDFTREEIENLFDAASLAHSAFGGSIKDLEPVSADSPIPFSADALVRSVEAAAEMMSVSEHVETLLIRIRSLVADSQLKAVIGNTAEITLEQWLENYIGVKEAKDGCLSIIDLSLVPSGIVHVVTAVAARMVFEALQRYRKLEEETLPTVLVMEEAHTFIKRYKDEIENHDAATVCCQVFERIAREGRKFGLGLVLSSQRPSELSPTVLSQCNTFLLHRISNDRDQDLVHRFVPDNLRGLLRELPSLPSQHAILLGWASELPILVRMDDLPKDQRPQSEDPDFWDVWTGQDAEGVEVKRPADWKAVADDWQGK
jgi:hypothetical protein